MIFKPHEFLIAWRYLKAKRSDGGVSLMSLISFAGITLAVFALISTMAVREGFRTEFLDTVLGANAHVELYPDTGVIKGYQSLILVLEGIDGVKSANPIVSGQIMVTSRGRSLGVEVKGIPSSSYEAMEGLSDAVGLKISHGAADMLPSGIAIGQEIARTLGIGSGEKVRLVSPDGVRTPFGTSPKVETYAVAHVFSAGRFDIDKTRIYMDLQEAQVFFAREGVADRIEIHLENPENLDVMVSRIEEILPNTLTTWTWKEANSSFLAALAMEDKVMFVILSILVLIAALNIISGLVMLVRNKGRDVGILRTMGLKQSGILRVFFICGATVGTAGTITGALLAVIFSLNIENVFLAIGALGGENIWDPKVRGIYEMAAVLDPVSMLKSCLLALGLSYTATLLPAIRAARMDPVEALRNE
jgi:lipoprotein-releasing system permease protein